MNFQENKILVIGVTIFFLLLSNSAQAGFFNWLTSFSTAEHASTSNFEDSNNNSAITSFNFAPGCLDGKAYEDFNRNGIEDSTEPGLSGITIEVFDDNNSLVGTDFTDSNGDWQVCSLSDGTIYRVEFKLPSNISSWATPSHSGSDNGTDVQFLTVPSSTKFGLSSPSDFCQENPYVGISCFGNGDPTAPGNGAIEAFVNFEYEANSPNGSTQTPPPILQAVTADIGATWGTAYQSSTKTVFASAVMRRYVGFGTLGTGGIYKMDFSDPTTSLPNTYNYDFIDVKTIGIPTGADTRNPSDTCNALATNPTDPAHDIDAFDAVGKIGIGDIHYDADNNTLWLVNLNDRKLYGIENIDPNTTPVSSDVIGGIDISLPGTDTCANGNLRPWAVTYDKGMIYVGAVCDSEFDGSSASLGGYVLKIDPNNLAAGFSYETTVDLDYARQGYGPTEITEWYKWIDFSTGPYWSAQPMITNIEFDSDGSIILGLMDRQGLQMGHQNYNHPVCSDNTLSHVSTAGDILRLCKSGGTYTQDSDTGCTTPANGNSIPGTDEFYWGDHGPYSGQTESFNENTTGGLAFLHGADEVLSTAFDPIDFYQGGVMTLDNTTGGDVNRYYIYNSTSNPAPTMGKSVGLGEPQLICNPAPLEVGNYVWLDAVKNGIQDPSESGISNMIVQLYDASGTKVGQDTTVAGQYYFNEANVDTTGITVNGSGIATANTVWSGLGYGKDYFIVYGDGQFLSGEFTIGSNTYSTATYDNVNGNSNDNIDSDIGINDLTSGNLGARPNGLPYIQLTTNSSGYADHKFDFGITNLSSTVGNRIWLDENADGIQDAGEPGIPNITVELLDDNGSVVATTITDANGGYIFKSVALGDYTIRVASGVPVGLISIFDEDDGTTSPDMETDLTVALDEYYTADFGYNYVSKANTDNPASMSATGTIGNRIWNDANGDGIQNAGESGIPNITVELLTDTDLDGVYTASGISTTTDIYGNYIFDNLAPNAYIVQVVDSGISAAGFTTTPTKDPDNDADNISKPIVIGPGDVWLGGDFGYNNPSNPADIGSTVFIDVDNSGSYAVSNDIPLAGVTVALIMDANNNGIWDTGEPLVATTTTDRDGKYLFPDLADNNYVVEVTDVNNVIDNFTNSVDPDGGTNEYSGVTLNGSDQLQEDFGYVPYGHTAGLGFIGNFVFLDADGQDDQDPFEPGIEGVTVELLDDASGNVVGVTTTDENGMYFFGGLSDNDYRVRVDVTTLPTGLINNVDPSGDIPGNNEGAAVTILSGSNDLDQDFGYKAATAYAVSGTIWEDSNAEGTLDGSESNRFNEVSINLLNANGQIISTTTTDPFGNYSFDNIPNGTYTVEVTDLSKKLSNYWHSIGADSENDPVTVLVNNANLTGIDFGYFILSSAIGNRVWEDTNNDGIQDPGEPAIENVVVRLEIDYNNDNVPEITMVDITDVNGFFSFENLLLDEDYVANGSGLTYTLSAATPATYDPTVIDVNTNGNDMEDSDDPAGVTATIVQGQIDVSQQGNPNTENSVASYDFGFSSAPLPIDLSMFDGRVENCSTKLIWVSETEENFDRFELEWSGDGRSYQKIYERNGKGGNETTTYTYLDRAASKFNYYRLKMVDIDGRYKYSDIVQLIMDCTDMNQGLTVYPNPIQAHSGNLNLKFFSERDFVNINIVDMIGRVVVSNSFKVVKDWNLVNMDISKLPAGSYNIQVIGSRNSRLIHVVE